MKAMRGTRRVVIGVMGSGREPHEDLAEPLGKWLAESGFDLLTGGGGGVMASVSRAFCGVSGRTGISIGVLPGDLDDEGNYVRRDGYPNDWVELPIRTHLPLSGKRGTARLSRNHLNVLSADVIVALPGSTGTRSELELAVRYGRPAILFLGDGTPPVGWPEVPVVRSIDEVRGFVRASVRSEF